MKRSIKFAAAFIAACLLFASFAACTNNGGGGESSGTEKTEQTAEPTERVPERTDTPDPTPLPVYDPEAPLVYDEPTRQMEFNPITAMDFTKSVGTGINVGNTLDATGSRDLTSETSWGNPKITAELFQKMKADGMDVVRLPVSWERHLSTAPEFKIEPAWFDRVQEVVDMAIDAGLYVILNTQHEDLFLLPNIAATKTKDAAQEITAIWAQIAGRFSGYSEKLIFDVMNEPRAVGTTYEWNGATESALKIINYLNKVALKAIRESGGHNAERLVMLPTYAASTSYISSFVLPVPPEEDPCVLVSVHAYSPYNFALNKKGTSVFTDDGSLEQMFKSLYDTFIAKGTAVIMDECGAMNKDNLADRLEWARVYSGAAAKYGVPCLLWDNGVYDASNPGESLAVINRKTLEWHDPEFIDIFITNLKK